MLTDVRKFIYATPTHVEAMEDSGSWSADDCSLSDETTNVRFYETSKKSIKVTCAGTAINADVYKTLASPIDIREHDVVITFYIPDASIADINTIRVELGDSASSNESRTYLLGSSFADFVTGHNWWSVKIPSIGGRATGTGISGNRVTGATNFQRIRFIIDKNNSTDTPELVIDSLRIVPSPSKASYFLTFDDGTDDDPTVASYMYALGLRGTFFINPNKVGTAGYVTLDQLKTMQSQGHLIANHSWDHEYLATDTMTVSEAIDSITKATAWLEDNGFTEGSRIWAVPGGSSESWGWSNSWRLLQDYCDIIRHTNSASLADGPLLLGDIYTSTFVTDDADIDNPTELLEDYFYDNKSSFVLGFHNWSGSGNIVDGGVIQPNYKTFLDTLADAQTAGNVDVLTLDRLISPQPDYPDIGNVHTSDTVNGSNGTLTIPSGSYCLTDYITDVSATYGLSGTSETPTGTSPDATKVLNTEATYGVAGTQKTPSYSVSANVPTTPTFTISTGSNSVTLTIDGDAGVTNYVRYKTTSDSAWQDGGSRSGDGDVTVSSLTDDVPYYFSVYSELAGAVSLFAPVQIVTFSTTSDNEWCTAASDMTTSMFDNHGESVTYIPSGGGSRDITAIVEFQDEYEEAGPYSRTPLAIVTVKNNATTGISAAEISSGRDKITLTMKDGTSQSRKIEKILNRDCAWVVLEVH